jgi:hypothetical protein
MAKLLPLLDMAKQLPPGIMAIDQAQTPRFFYL